MLRRVDSAQLVHEPGWFGSKGPFLLVVGGREFEVGRQPKWKREEVEHFYEASQNYPAWIATVQGKRYWFFLGRIFSENERLSQEEVHALLVSRDQYNQRRVDRAVAAVRQDTRTTSYRRQGIPDEVKQYVWQRDGGRCRNCWSDSELQFDHIIPVAMGGSSEPENLQLLCGPCNRAKGAGLTNRGVPPGPSWG